MQARDRLVAVDAEIDPLLAPDHQPLTVGERNQALGPAGIAKHEEGLAGTLRLDLQLQLGGRLVDRGDAVSHLLAL